MSLPTNHGTPAPATKSLAERIRVARGLSPCELLLTNVRVVNVCTYEIMPLGAVAIHDGLVVGFGAEREAQRTLDLEGRFLAPSFIDGHVHLESSMVVPREFARAVVPAGTGAVICDPHEIANVLGADGVRYILEASEGLPLDVFVNVPSCVPATPLETAGASLDADAVAALLESHARVLGLAEMMNVPGVLFGDEQVLAKLGAAGTRPRDGHAPTVRGNDLSGYLVAGIGADHESVTADEARDKLRQGMMLQIREGSAAKNLREMLKVVTPGNAYRCMFCTDDRHPHDLLTDGHINAVVRDAVDAGIPEAVACAMGSFTAARHYGLTHPPRGAVAPGYLADLIAFERFETLKPSHVFKRGQVVARDGELLVGLPAATTDGTTDTVHVNPQRLPEIRIPAPAAASESPELRVIVAEHGSLITEETRKPATLRDGTVISDPASDTLKLVVVERHTGEAGTGVAFVTGFGLQRGALATSVAHDSHNLIAVGVTDAEIHFALRELIRLQGGCVVVDGEQVTATFALPVAGLMSPAPIEEAAQAERDLTTAAKQLGCKLPNPFMTLSFLALPPIPKLKLTDRGLVDAERFEVVPLFASEPLESQ